jgi:cyclase
MTLTKRVVVCLDVSAGRVVKGTQFVDLVDVGDPVALAERYERDGADEIVFLDIGATPSDRMTVLDVARSAADRLFIPLTIGGGIRSVDDVARALRSGADKVSVNSAAVSTPSLIHEASVRFGAQCVVASIDAKQVGEGRWQVYVAGGRRPTTLDALEWARDVARLGAGEILLTSIDRDGTRAGYDLELTRAVADAVDVPVIASGGAGSAADVAAVLRDANADAALIAGIVHSGTTSVGEIKNDIARAGLRVRDSFTEIGIT